ncbi:hypothetical protein D3C80_1074260 [compost metagenome]
MDRLAFIPVPDQLDAIKCAWTRGVITPQLERGTQWVQPGIFGQKIVFPTLDRRQYTDYNERSEAGIGFINRSRVLRHVYSLTEQRAGRTTEKHLSGEWLEKTHVYPWVIRNNCNNGNKRRGTLTPSPRSESDYQR